MPTSLTVQATERSTLIITAAFSDEDGNPAVPDSLFYTLVDENNNIINAIENITVSVLAVTVQIILSGADLLIQDSEANLQAVERFLVLEGQYDSQLQNNLSINDEVNFQVYNLKYVDNT